MFFYFTNLAKFKSLIYLNLFFLRWRKYFKKQE